MLSLFKGNRRKKKRGRPFGTMTSYAENEQVTRQSGKN